MECGSKAGREDEGGGREDECEFFFGMRYEVGVGEG